MTTIGKQASESHARVTARRTRFGKMFSLLALSSVVVNSLALSSCGGGTGAVDISSVSITPTAITVPINTQTDFTATVKLTNSSVSTTTTVSWEVNGIAGGNSTVGTIVPSSTDQLIGVYTAPAAVPTTSSGSGLQVGQVQITAVATQTSTSSSSSSSTNTVTSNTAIVTVGVGLGLSITPPSAIVPAGGSTQFSAILNGVATAAVWTLSSPSGGNLGTIDTTGLYTAPAFPPPGASVTVTATASASDGTPVNTNVIVTIVYSDHSLSGPYAFSYEGNDASGLLAVAGSFVADGNGRIVSGVEDVQSFLTGVSTQVPISGTYRVGSDGRGSASLSTSRGTNTWQFVLSTNQHAQMIRFDTNTTGGGSIDQQSLNGLTNSPAVISGRYAFAAQGLDQSLNPLAIAGEFLADGAGAIPSTNATLDVNDNGISGSGTVTTNDTTLNGSYQFDAANPGTGRGTLLLQSTTTGATARMFAFYAVGTATNSSDAIVVSQLHLVEIDSAASVAGDAYLAAQSPSLASGNYVFTAGGNSTAGAFASGGVFTSDGTSATTGGMLDVNNNGIYNSGVSLGSCTFSVNAPTGRVDLKVFAGSGACPSGANSAVSEFAAYPTALGSVVMLQLDSAAVSTGLAYQQCGPQSAGCAGVNPSLTAVSLALGLSGTGLFHNPPATAISFQPDLDGQLSLTGLGVSAGNLDINNFSAAFAGDPVASTGNTIGSSGSNGRGTATIAASNPTVTYKSVYYLIDDNHALLFSSGQSPVATGSVARQF